MRPIYKRDWVGFNLEFSVSKIGCQTKVKELSALSTHSFGKNRYIRVTHTHTHIYIVMFDFLKLKTFFGPSSYSIFGRLFHVYKMDKSYIPNKIQGKRCSRNSRYPKHASWTWKSISYQEKAFCFHICLYSFILSLFLMILINLFLNSDSQIHGVLASIGRRFTVEIFIKYHEI